MFSHFKVEPLPGGQTAWDSGVGSDCFPVVEPADFRDGEFASEGRGTSSSSSFSYPYYLVMVMLWDTKDPQIKHRIYYNMQVCKDLNDLFVGILVHWNSLLKISENSSKVVDTNRSYFWEMICNKEGNQGWKSTATEFCCSQSNCV